MIVTDTYDKTGKLVQRLVSSQDEAGGKIFGNFRGVDSNIELLPGSFYSKVDIEAVEELVRKIRWEIDEADRKADKGE